MVKYLEVHCDKNIYDLEREEVQNALSHDEGGNDDRPLPCFIPWNKCQLLATATTILKIFTYDYLVTRLYTRFTVSYHYVFPQSVLCCSVSYSEAHTASKEPAILFSPGRAFTPGERTPGTQCTGGWVGPRAGLDTEARGKILCPHRGSNPGRPARSQTLYCLS
jgi:hypothetical protein